MADRLTKTPRSTADTHFYPECRYCQITDMGHEKELIAKAKKLCKHYRTNHFLDYVTSHLDILNHAVLTPITQIEILTQIHNSLECDCLNETTTTIQDLTKSTDHVTIPQAYAPTPQTTTPTTHTHAPKKPGKTLLERLQNGKNGTHKTG